MNIIINKQKKAIINAYYYRIQALGIDLKRSDLEKKLLSLDANDLKSIFNDMMKGNEENIILLLNKLGITASNKQETINNLQNQVKKSLNLSDITEFNNNRKDYFKFKSKDGSIYIVRNFGNDSKQLFLDILNNRNVANSENGKNNTSEIFKFLKRKQFIEVSLQNSTNVNDNDIPKNQITIIREIEKQFPDKQIIVGLNENLYIVKGNLNEEDIILSITKENGKYKVSPLVQKTYGSKPDENSKENTQNNSEVPNDIIIELEANEEISQIIEDGLNSAFPEEIIKDNVIETINNKYPRFKNILSLNVIIMSLIQKVKDKKKGSQNNLGGKKYVLTNNKNSINYTDDKSA